jgi:DNA mismatch repair protein MutL
MDAYQRQIVPGTYPFALVCIDIDPDQVDVNVHPRKQQVKFLDPGSIFNRVKRSIHESIGNQQVNYAAFNQQEVRTSSYSPTFTRS